MGTTVAVDLANIYATIDPGNPDAWAYGVYCSGDIDVDAARLTSNVHMARTDANTNCYPLFSTGGSIHIANGSVVNATTDGHAKYQNGLYASESLVISDSTVSVDGGTNVDYGYNGTGGICASVTNDDHPATLSVTNSNVTAKGDRAMTSWTSMKETVPTAISSLALTDCHFTEPVGAATQDTSVNEFVDVPDRIRTISNT